jgi:hypothetical protein
MDPSLLVFLVAIAIVGVLVFLAISMTGKRSHIFNKEDYQVDFLRIEQSLSKDNASSYAMAIIEGDKLLDRALMEMGVQGRTMGDRLKRVGKTKFTQLNSVWYAHKLRNQIAHEHDFKPEYRQALHALETYKQALKDLGAI